jgi:uncharacterized repeat protein (TIGR01451 family)
VIFAGDSNTGNNSATDNDTLAVSASLGIANTDGVTTATPGGSVDYLINVTNAGPSDADHAKVTDRFPSSLDCSWSCTSSGGSSCETSGSGKIDHYINLKAGGNATYMAHCDIDAGAYGSLNNTAKVKFAGVDVSAQDSNTLVKEADLGITKSDGLTAAIPGESVTYTIVASNAGPSDVDSVTVTDNIPNDLDCNWTCNSNGGGSCSASGSGDISDNIDLPAGGSATYTAICNIDSAASGSIVNTATISAAEIDPAFGNNSATDTDSLPADSADLAITNSDGTDMAIPGGSLTYTITAVNSGFADVSDASVTDSFPTELSCSWTCAGSSGGQCSAAGSGDINDNAILPMGSSVTYTATCDIALDAEVEIINTASVYSAVVTDPVPQNNTSTDICNVITDVMSKKGFE